MTKTGSGLLGLLLAAGVLSACAPPQAPRLDVEAQWGEAISNLGMFAVYPPSEDVMVGDAFLYLPDTQYFDLVRVTSAPLKPLSGQFCFQESDRMVLDKIAGAGGDVAKQPAADCRNTDRKLIATHDGAMSKEHATRLREAAIPLLEVGRFSEGELAGAGLLGNFGGALGIGTSGQVALRLELRNLQSLTLDELRGSRLLEDISRSRVERLQVGKDDYPNSLTPLMLARSLRLADHRNGTNLSGQFCRGDFATMNASGARVVVANRVLYAGGVSFEFMSSRVTSVKLAVDFASVLAGMPQNPVVPAGLGAKAKPKDGEDGGAGGDDADKKKEEEEKKKAAESAKRPALDGQLAGLLSRLEGLATLDADKAGQVAGRLAAGRFGNLAMNHTFTRPAAVGMGAALHFPVGEAAVPAGQRQIAEVIAFCNATHAEAGVALREQLAANYQWAYFLYRRNMVGEATALLDAETEGARARRYAGLEARKPGMSAQSVAPARLPAMRMDAKVRVRP